ncbi:LysR family transcriptional regulator [Leucobacter komagatae]|uniref:LysR family transcriptional regulator n=1 Tax=Leucobacter komagatae TaxID=55969 RepID=A0A0D0IRF8_9MICO|nr:LysR family transcriptional regulator [Leucobacter komagatae]KIP53542.1 LysR family transcriptional regulator [Leucobacter komagatae]
MDLEALRTYLAVVEAERFQAAADELGITQQAVSKRIAALERSLGATLFVRLATGVELTVEGRSLLPHARELIDLAARAAAAVRPEGRALRVDVLNTRTAPATALRDFHRSHPEYALDVIELSDATPEAAVRAVGLGTLDATFRALPQPRGGLPTGIRAERVIDDAHELLVGPGHALANREYVSLDELSAHEIWMPGMRAATEWGGYYEALSAEFRLTITTAGPSFGADSMLDSLADSTVLATLIGEGSRYLWPETHGLRRIPIAGPTPVYPHSLVWREENTHPGLAAFITFLRERRAERALREPWVPLAFAGE